MEQSLEYIQTCNCNENYSDHCEGYGHALLRLDTPLRLPAKETLNFAGRRAKAT
jgi:hypothetical protein